MDLNASLPNSLNSRKAYNLFLDIRDALAAGETYYSLETYMDDNPFRVPAQQREKHTTV